MKECIDCKQSRPRNDFQPVRTALDGLAPFCNTCVNQFVKAYRVKEEQRRRSAGAKAGGAKNKGRRPQPAAEAIQTKKVMGSASTVLTEEEIIKLRAKLNINVEDKQAKPRATRRDAGKKRGLAICTSEDCDRPTLALGLCSMHYQRYKAAS